MAFVAGMFVVSTIALGQVSTGTINVVVQDSTGAVVLGSSVTITHVQTGQVRQGQTNQEGALRVTFLPIGEYTVSAEAAGFPAAGRSEGPFAAGRDETARGTLERTAPIAAREDRATIAVASKFESTVAEARYPMRRRSRDPGRPDARGPHP
jgi:hypothetical protein